MPIVVTADGTTYVNSCSVPLVHEREPERGPVVRMQQVLNNCENLKTRLDNIDSTTHTFTQPVAFNGNVTIGDSHSDTLSVQSASTFDATVGFNAAVTCSNVATFANNATFNGNARIYGVLDVRASGNLGYTKSHAIAVLGTLVNDIEIVALGGDIYRNGDCASRIAISNTPGSGSVEITFTTTNAIQGSSKRIAYNGGTVPVHITDDTTGVSLGTLTTPGNSVEITFSAGRWWTS